MSGLKIDKLLQKLINEETNETKKAIFETLFKCSNQVFFSTNTSTDFPFLYVKGNQLTFTFKHKELSDAAYIYTDYHDIHTMLHHLFYENFSIYLCYEEVFPFTEAELWEKIDEALEKGDQSSFTYYASFLKK